MSADLLFGLPEAEKMTIARLARGQARMVISTMRPRQVGCFQIRTASILGRSLHRRLQKVIMPSTNLGTVRAFQDRG